MIAIEDMSARCRALSHPNPFTVALASVLVVGLVVSYLPQHFKIIKHRTSEGLSPWWVLLGGLSSIAAIANILTLPGSRADLNCCKEISGGACAAALLGVLQIGAQWACFMFIVMLFLIFFPTKPEADLSNSTASLTASLTQTPPPKRRDAVIVGSVTLVTLLAVGIISIALVSAWPHHTQTWANLLGSVAGVVSAIQYLPQIWYTYRLRDVKSLSVITMFIQVPGAFLFSFSLWQRVGWEGWSTWLVYITTACLQSILLGLAIHYNLQRKKEQAVIEDMDGLHGGEDVDITPDSPEVDERSALLGSGGTKGTPINGTRRSAASQRQLGILYAATPPEHDSDRSSSGRGDRS